MNSIMQNNIFYRHIFKAMVSDSLYILRHNNAIVFSVILLQNACFNNKILVLILINIYNRSVAVLMGCVICVVCIVVIYCLLNDKGLSAELTHSSLLAAINCKHSAAFRTFRLYKRHNSFSPFNF